MQVILWIYTLLFLAALTIDLAVLYVLFVIWLERNNNHQLIK
jgi:hypothetical protein